MFSTVGYQSTPDGVAKAAAQLEYDCVAAYREAAKRAHGRPAGDGYSAMAGRCAGHVERWQQRLGALGEAPARPSQLSETLNRLKVKAAACLGDRAIALAVLNNAGDRASAYARVARKPKFGVEVCELAKTLHGVAQDDQAWMRRQLRG